MGRATHRPAGQGLRPVNPERRMTDGIDRTEQYEHNDDQADV